MERNASDRGTRLIDRARTMIRDWFLPLVIMLAWTVALTYTLVAVTRLPWRAATPSQKPTPVVHAPAQSQPTPSLRESDSQTYASKLQVQPRRRGASPGGKGSRKARSSPPLR
jgi:hypothetical protein